MKKQTLFSPFDGLSLSVAISEPQGAPIGIIQFSHGMAEHKSVISLSWSTLVRMVTFV